MISSCPNNSNHKRKKHSQTVPAPSGCSSPSTETAAVEKQSNRVEPQGEPGIDPMFAEVAVDVVEKAVDSGHKWAKLVTSKSSPPEPLLSASPKIVQVSEGQTADTVEPPLRRQYLTRSRDVASSSFGHPGKPVGMGRCPSRSFSMADSRTQGNTVCSLCYVMFVCCSCRPVFFFYCVALLVALPVCFVFCYLGSSCWVASCRFVPFGAELLVQALPMALFFIPVAAWCCLWLL